MLQNQRANQRANVGTQTNRPANNTSANKNSRASANKPANNKPANNKPANNRPHIHEIRGPSENNLSKIREAADRVSYRKIANRLRKQGFKNYVFGTALKFNEIWWPLAPRVYIKAENSANNNNVKLFVVSRGKLVGVENLKPAPPNEMYKSIEKYILSNNMGKSKAERPGYGQPLQIMNVVKVENARKKDRNNMIQKRKRQVRRQGYLDNSFYTFRTKGLNDELRRIQRNKDGTENRNQQRSLFSSWFGKR